jgi:hypothetical protein
MQTGSSGTLIGCIFGQTTFVPLWDLMGPNGGSVATDSDQREDRNEVAGTKVAGDYGRRWLKW